MNTMQLECFIEVVENLNFARAARKLHISQPSVTHQINSLEEELDTKLFKRTTRSVRLTDAGQTFYPDAQNMLNIMKFAHTKLHNDSMLKVTPIGIGCHSSFDLNLISRILMKLNSDRSHIHPIIKTIPFQSITNLLRDEAIDILLSYDDNIKKENDFRFTKLTDAVINVVLPSSHPLAAMKAITESDLYGERLIVLNPNRTSSQISEIQRKLFINFDPADVFIADSPEICSCLVNAGFGITLMPSLPFMTNEALVYIPFEPGFTISYGIYSKKNAADSPLKEFISAAKEIMQTEAVPE